ncbi:glycosyltransferase 61 family protein [Roseomonas fluvialis]|nr:glycosyltransferase 61 family protein [Roseomonas fluvialis]
MPAIAERSGGFQFSLGAFDAVGDPVTGVAHRRHGGVTVPPAPPAAPPALRWSGPHLYAGVVFGQFGHFVAESLSRLWAMRAAPEAALVWHRHPAWTAPGLSRWQQDVLALAGLGGRTHRFIDAPVVVDDILVPEQGHVMGHVLHPAQVRALGVHPFRAPQAGRRLWVSRSALAKANGMIEREDELEALLRDRRWEVVHPERRDVAAQLALYEDAEILAGFEGSAFHLLLMGRDIRARVLLLDRRLAPAQHRTYDIIAQALGFPQERLSVALDPVRGRGNTGTWRLQHPAAAAAALDSAAGAP